ncbi:MAG: hypothetical protein V1731_01335 [Candidatus Aenigmatarchaeota archaeon]
MKTCNTCRREFPDSYNYCAACGNSLRMLAFPIALGAEHLKYEWD